MDWFLSLRKKRSANKESEDASENSNENTSNVFYTIRHFKKKLQKSSKVKHVQRDTGDAELSSEGELPAFPPPSEEFRIPVEINEVPNPPNLVPFNEPSSDMDCLMEKTRKELKKYKWFWPNFSRELAQNRLSKQANGSFLVRDSQTVNQFTLSFRSSGCTLHVRIDYKNNYWSFIDNIQSKNLVNLIENTVSQSKTSILGYVKQNCFPVRLNYPIKRSTPTLQELCLDLIKYSVAPSNIDYLPLPLNLKNLLELH